MPASQELSAPDPSRFVVAVAGTPEDVDEAARRRADRYLAELAENAAKVGLLVTDGAVVDLDEAA